MRESRTSGSVGGWGGKPPWPTRRALGEAWIERMVETPKFNIETQRVKVPPNQDWSSVGSESCAGPG